VSSIELAQLGAERRQNMAFRDVENPWKLFMICPYPYAATGTIAQGKYGEAEARLQPTPSTTS
jgi:hypothetical protein